MYVCVCVYKMEMKKIKFNSKCMMYSHLRCVKYFTVVPVCLAECLTLKLKLLYISDAHCSIHPSALTWGTAV